MSKMDLASLVTVLLWASVTLGQEPGASLPPAVPPPPAQVGGCAEGSLPCGVEAGATQAGMVTADLEYVLWFLATSRNSMPTAATDVLGRSDSFVVGALADAEHGRKGPVSGTRFALGYWAVEDNPWVPGGIRDLGVETVFFFVGQRGSSFVDTTTPTIVRPFFDLNNRQESGFIVTAPGLATGGIAASAQVELWGAEANVWKNVYHDLLGTTCSLDVMAGFRYLSMDQRLAIESTSAFNRDLTAFPAFLSFAGNTLEVLDSFATHNRFYGGQIGVAGKWWPVQWMLIEGGVKVGIGATAEDLEIGGGQLRTLANSARIFSQGGLLALPSNSGSFHNNKFAQVPELNLKVAALYSSHLKFSVGFSALYWSRVLRPGQQIDREIDITQIPNFPPAAGAIPTGLNQPGVLFKQSDLWVLGISFGFEVNW
jgi:hypothetical protein